MTEKFHNEVPESIDLAQYDELVAETCRWNQRVTDEDWRQPYADYIRDEALEFLGQHGNTALLLLPSEFWIIGADNEETILGAADELSDMFWFGFDTARRLSSSGAEVCSNALQRRFGVVAVTFNDMQRETSDHAHELCVRNKRALAYGQNGKGAETSLAQNPFYVFMRMSNRLCRALDPEPAIAGPPTASDFEAPNDPLEAVGDFLITLSYVASLRLGWQAEDIALYNFQKLLERDRWGKSMLAQ